MLFPLTETNSLVIMGLITRRTVSIRLYSGGVVHVHEGRRYRGGSGIGEAVARQFASIGAEVVISGRNSDRLEDAVRRLGNVRGEVADGASEESCRRLFETVGAFDYLVLTLSGGRGAGPIASTAIEDIRSGSRPNSSLS